MTKLTGAALDRAVAHAMGLKSVHNCEKWSGAMDETQPAQEPDMLTIAYQSGYHDGKKAALAGREWNFCERCGKRTADKTVIHTCTPPQ
jgi:hypothetical protein